MGFNPNRAVVESSRVVFLFFFFGHLGLTLGIPEFGRRILKRPFCSSVTQRPKYPFGIFLCLSFTVFEMG